MAETLHSCPNCGESRHGPFCQACGQNDRDYLRSAHRIVGEAVEDVFDVDSRIFRTLKALLFSPGLLTIEFSRGRRVSYVSPVRLYLIVSVVFFFVLSFASELVVIDVDGVQVPAAEPGSEIGRLTQERLRIFSDDPSRMLDALVNDLPIALFVVLPLYAGLLKLCYMRRWYTEHLVFALHLHSFLFILGTVALLLPESVPGEWLHVVEGVYYFVALRRVYPESTVRNVIKFVAINIGHLVLIAIALVLTATAALFLA